MNRTVILAVTLLLVLIIISSNVRVVLESPEGISVGEIRIIGVNGYVIRLQTLLNIALLMNSTQHFRNCPRCHNFILILSSVMMICYIVMLYGCYVTKFSTTDY